MANSFPLQDVGRRPRAVDDHRHLAVLESGPGRCRSRSRSPCSGTRSSAENCLLYAVIPCDRPLVRDEDLLLTGMFSRFPAVRPDPGPASSTSRPAGRGLCPCPPCCTSPGAPSASPRGWFGLSPAAFTMALVVEERGRVGRLRVDPRPSPRSCSSANAAGRKSRLSAAVTLPRDVGQEAPRRPVGDVGDLRPHDVGRRTRLGRGAELVLALVERDSA